MEAAMTQYAEMQRGHVALRDLLPDVPEIQRFAPAVTVRDICLDSRKVVPGSLFLAIVGYTLDGHDYIADAIRAGACAVLYESGDYANRIVHPQVPHLHVRDLRSQAGCIASRFFDHPSQKLKVVGITGTNGKTTVAWLCASALQSLGRPCGMIGTLGTGYPGSIESGAITTPDAIEIQSQLAKYAERGDRFACMEVSSHGLAQHRAAGTQFHTVALTNIASDHLDYHADEDEYWGAKRALFEQSRSSAAVVNADQQRAVRMLNSGLMKSSRTITYGTAMSGDSGQLGGTGANQFKDIEIAGVRTAVDHLEVDLKLPATPSSITIRSRLVGRVNAMNIAAAAGILYSLGCDASEISRSLSGLVSAPGRLQRVCVDRRAAPRVFVDFAHTADALSASLASLRELTEGELWCVFGCGGDRDEGKRKKMGIVAEQLADQVVITDDNPRNEEPAKIVKQILAGMKARPNVEHNRAKAIRFAISNAGPRDIVLVAGKGHEASQIYGETALPFDDREVVKDALESAA